MKRGILILLLILFAAACGEEEPEAEPTLSGPTALPASPTIDPVSLAQEGSSIRDPGVGEMGVSNPTQAALAAEGEPENPIGTVTPQPTEAELPVLISASDGLVLRGTFYAAAVRPAPGVLLLHQRGSDRSSWDVLAQRLQALNYAVLAIDLRGYGETGGAEDWTLAPGDVRATLQQLATLSGVSPERIVVIGASVGANLGLNACADYSGCMAAVLLSPGLDYRGITTAEAVARLGFRPMLIAAGENDRNNPADSVTLDGSAAGDHQLVIYPENAHGTALFDVRPELLDLIVNWLSVRVAPPVPVLTPVPPT
ncbi:MAG: alpha/beta fold hydrolase [Chloroflexi bacterium]|nr:alpha/beta fold hydrolase [Chloroflexota bacterium]